MTIQKFDREISRREFFYRSIIGSTALGFSPAIFNFPWITGGYTGQNFGKSSVQSDSANIKISPTQTRVVEIHHLDWDLKWTIQFPENIMSMNGVTMMWNKICPHWIQLDENVFSYEWRTTPQYIAEQLEHSPKDSSGNIIRHNFIIGLALKAELSVVGNTIELVLTLKNESSSRFYSVYSDGGCFQAKNPEFRNHDEVKRSYVIVKSKLESMADLHRTVDIRTTYHTDLMNYEKDWINRTEWFWGRSKTVIDYPAIVGAVSQDESKYVVLGYEGATSASQNADGHHCLHSRPHFGDIPPGETVTRRGYILFGSELSGLVEKLRARLNNPSQDH